MTVIDVRLRSEWVERIGYRYDVLLDGEIIVRRSRDPEYAAARALLARGMRGTFRTIDFRTGKPRMILDIEKAAKLRTVERNDGPPTVRRYRPLSDDVRALLSAHTSHRGRAAPNEVVQGTGPPVEAAGSETCVGSRRFGDGAAARRVREDA